MYFKNERHRQAFRDGMKKTNRKDRESVSAVYLLSAEPCLWRRAKQTSIYGKILLNNVRLTGIRRLILWYTMIYQFCHYVGKIDAAAYFYLN